MEQRLYDAAVAGDVTSLLQLIEEDPLLLDKANLNCQDKNPLHIAAMFGHVNFVKKILQNNSNMCLAPDRFGRNPLHLAAIEGRLHVLQELIHARPQAARKKTAGGDTVLHLCIEYKQLEALKDLVKTIKDHEFVNMKNGDGMTVLHLAICDNQNEAIKYLLQNKKVDVNAKNANGNTALDLFQGDTNSEIARSLKTAGAKRAKDIDASTAGNAPKNVDWLTRKRDSLMVAASLIATMTFQAGVTPPGGVWQDDSKLHMAGEAVMAHNRPGDYNYFFVANTVAFISSLSVILLLISGLPFRRSKFLMWALVVVMWMTVSAAALTYITSSILVTPKSDNITSSILVTPKSDKRDIAYSIGVISDAIKVWLVVMAVLLLWTTLRLLYRCLRFLLLHLGNAIRLLLPVLWNAIRLLTRWVKFLCIQLLKKIKPGNGAVREHVQLSPA